MPSPFPGMDPYLEHPAHWPDAHHEIISVAREILNRQVRPKYVCRIEERVYISDEFDSGSHTIIPDLRIFTATGEQSNVAVALQAAEPVVATTMFELEIHEARIEVLDAEKKSVITVIEVLSPSNKVPGSTGLQSYREKRQEVMSSAAHFVEMDLLRAGSRFRVLARLAESDYRVHVSRADRRPKGFIWPIDLKQPLPVISIPLKEPDESTPLDLQQVITTVYDRANYDLTTDYREDPVPPLKPEQATWAEELLHKKGLR